MCMLKSLGPTAWMASTTSVPARAVWPTSMQQPMRGSMFLIELEDVEGRLPELVLRAVVVDGDADVVFLDELLDTRKTRWRWITGDNHIDAGTLGVLELAADVVVLILGEVHGADGVQLDSIGGVVGDSGGLLGRIHGEMVFGVLAVEIADLELLHVGDHLVARELAEGVAGEAEMDGHGAVGLRRVVREPGTTYL